MNDSGVKKQAFVAVGSNISPRENIPVALGMLKQQVSVTATSTFYRTKPLGRPGQPDFLNGVWKISTLLAPGELKYGVLRLIEAELGRRRTDDKYAPRPIDLDLVMYENAVLDEEGLTLPDPEIRTRPFIAVPLKELAPGLILPDTNQPLAEIPAAGKQNELTPDRDLTRELMELLKR